MLSLWWKCWFNSQSVDNVHWNITRNVVDVLNGAESINNLFQGDKVSWCQVISMSNHRIVVSDGYLFKNCNMHDVLLMFMDTFDKNWIICDATDIIDRHLAEI